MSTTSKRTNKRSRTESESSVSALSQTNSEKDVNAPQESIITESTSSMQSPQIPPSHESNFIFQQGSLQMSIAIFFFLHYFFFQF